MAIINVPSDFPTIQSAINAANPGDTIVIAAGTYAEGVTVNKSLTIEAQTPGNVTIDGQTVGFDVTANGSGTTIEGLNIVNSSGVGIELDGASNVTVQGNTIGVTTAGNTAAANGIGIELENGADNNIIGGAGVGEGNVISGNAGTGILVDGSNTNTIIGNLIGTNAAGTAALGNGYAGIWLKDGAKYNAVGGTAAGDRNVISGNGAYGIYLQAADSNTVSGNFIGTDITGTTALGNTGIGIAIGSSLNDVIGGTGSGAGNVIADNRGAGVSIGGGYGDTVRGNSISDNGFGIVLASHANRLQTSPVLSQALTTGTQVEISGSLSSTASQTFAIDFYSNTGTDSNGNAEGQTFLGSTSVTTDAGGNGSFDATLAANVALGEIVTATATNTTTGDTSEFSPALPVPTFVVTNLNDSGAGSLRQAIADANAAGGSHTIEFAANLAGGTLTLTNGELDITSDITIDGDIDGNGTPDITVTGNHASRVFAINSDATLDGLVITDGSSSNGGGIIVDGGAALTLSNSTVLDSSASGSGGAIDNDGSLTVVESTLSGNTAAGGGAIYSTPGSTIVLLNTTLSNDTAGQQGGAIASASGVSVSAINTTLSGNSAAFGGGLYSFGGAVSLINSTVSGNQASSEGGGLDVFGGALTLNNSIVAGNSAFAANDVYASGGTTFTAANDIFGSALSVPVPPVNGTNGTIVIDGSNATELGNVFANVGSDPNTGVLSGLLGNNGGLVQTVALNPTGVAVDAGSNADLPDDTYDLNNNGNTTEPLPVDARGFDRAVGTSVDIGAFEQQAAQNFVVTTLNDELDSTIPNATLADMGPDLSLREALFLANEDPTTADTITFDPSLANGTIDLTLGALASTGNVTIDGDIDGNGTPDIAIDAHGNSQVLSVGGGTATVDGLVLTRGSSVLGGGVSVYNGANLTVADSAIYDSSALVGGGLAVGVGSAVTLTRTTVAGNYATDFGGGIVSGGALTLYNSTVSGNGAATGVGGGIDVVSGSAVLTNTTLSGNYSETSSGGGIYNAASLTLTNSTLSGNYAATSGGGIYDCTGSSLTLSNSIAAGNGDSVSNTDNIAGAGTATYSSGNIVGGTFSIDGTVVQTGVTLGQVFASVSHNHYTDVLSGTLRNNGGPVDTIALKANGTNPAIDSGNPNALNEATAGIDLNGNGNQTDTITTDARGFARDVNFSGGGANPDLGAFEQQLSQSFVVTTLSDELDSTNPNARLADMGPQLSLREALFLANEDPASADTITFDPSLAGGTIDLTRGDLQISGGVTIDGGASGITIDAEGNSGIFDVTGGTSTLNKMTLTGGYVGYGGGYPGHGGAVVVGASSVASLTISNSSITDSAAAYGGGIAIGYRGSVQLTNSVVSGNNAFYVGGGILNSGTLTLTNSVVSGNTAAYIGGGIASRGELTVINSTLANNRIDTSPTGPLGGYDPGFSAGAGLYNGGTAALLNTTIAGNTGAYAGGGIYNSKDLTLTNVTVGDNSAANGGGLYNARCGCGDVSIYDSTFTGNSAIYSGGGIANANGSVALTNSIVAGNGATEAPDLASYGTATTTYAGVNLFSQAGIGRPGVDITQPDISKIFNNVTTVDPDGVPNTGDEFQAGVLANNGGAVQTVTINAAGSARDTGVTADLPADTFDLDSNGNTTEPLPVDARGDPRVSGPSVDIGAYEQQPVPTPTNIVVTTLSDEPYNGGDIGEETADGNGLSLREAIGLANAAGGSHTITFASDLAGGTLTLTNGELDITGDVTIDGDVHGDDGLADGSGKDDITINGNGSSGIFELNDATSVLNGLTITGGYGVRGGGIYAIDGSNLTVTNSTLAGNIAKFQGGAISTDSSAVRLVNTTLSGNSVATQTSGRGGAIYSSQGSLSAINVTISGNTARGEGGGLWGYSSDVSLIDSTVSGNISGYGGGIGEGGGLALFGGTLTLTNSVVAGNASSIAASDLSASVSALNFEGGDILGSNPFEVGPTTGSYRAIAGTSAAALGTVFDTVGDDPNTGVLSGLLANNGGPVDTIAINPTGIAHNGGVTADLPPDTTDINRNGNTTEPLPDDARGEHRVAGTAVDIGAFEQNQPTPSNTTAIMVMDRGYDGTYQAYDITQNAVQLTAMLGVISSPWQVADVGLFAGNTDAEMFMRNAATGAFELYDIASNSIANPVPMGQVGPEWQILGFGDFSSNAGETDMLMRNTTTQALELYDISHNAYTGFVPMGAIGPEWQAAGFGDFSGNANETDMLMRNTATGAFELYDISHNAYTAFVPMGQVGPEWQTLGFGDFSGNANETDMLMRNTTTGALELYDISKNAYTAFIPLAPISLDWQVAGFADFSGNANETDMLMRNRTTGAFQIYDISHNAIASVTPMGQVGPEWQTAGTASIPSASAPAGALLAQALSSFGTTGSGSTVPSGSGGAGTPSGTDNLFTGQGSHS